MAAADPFSEGETLDRASDLPLFLQIRQRLLREILDWPTADRRFPPEAQLAEHGASSSGCVDRIDRATDRVRSALVYCTLSL